ncbi:MAG: 4-hydroxy-3-methylbut-2-enyl diphosphate reductase [Clostridiales bacterium]|nr:4-hydroxy-3-methylbut-2-enyl diphosphate reductase [Clostridiales bacterium]
MKVILANVCGVCFGVEKAIKMTHRELSTSQRNEPIYALGQLIHNPQVIEDLEKAGLKTIENLNQISKGTVIIRSHGVGKETYELANSKSLKIVDTTCPFVTRIQKIVTQYYSQGYQIIIIGNPSHPEVIGLNGWCSNKASIVENENDLMDISNINKICVVAQTTVSVEKFEKICKIINMKNKGTKIFHTICDATAKRQEVAKNLAINTEAVIVIGGYNSSNTNKLVDICREIRPNSTYHVETVAEIDISEIIKYETVGVTAGASTSSQTIYDVLNRLKVL